MSQEAAQLSVNSGDLEEADDSGLSVPPETCVMLRQLLGRQKGYALLRTHRWRRRDS